MDIPQDYFVTIIYPDGEVSRPTLLLFVHDTKAANRKRKQFEKAYPNCQIKITVEVSPE